MTNKTNKNRMPTAKKTTSYQRLIQNSFLYMLILYLFSQACMASDQLTNVTISVAKSLANTGVLQILSERFQQHHPEIKIQINSVGSLQALEHARLNQADLVITHFPLEEKRLVQQGFVSKRTELIESKFAVFGPSSDQYHIKEKTRITDVLTTLAKNEATFFVPSAMGGTHAKIKELWSLSGIYPNWIGYEYSQVSGLGAMNQAAAEGGYTIADLGTYLSNKASFPTTFIPLYQNDITLQNIYSVLVTNTKSKAKNSFYRYLISPQGQTAIKNISNQIYSAAIINPIANFDPELIAEQKEKKIKQQNEYLLIGFGSLAIISVLLFLLLYQNKRVHNLLLKEHQTEKENQHLQETLHQAQKMESLGKLTGGIAHDFNNLLVVIMGYSELANKIAKTTGNDELMRYVNHISTAGDRAKNLVSQMLTFSRNQKVEDKPLQIAPIVESCSGMLQPMLTSSINLKLNIENDIPRILINKTQLEQALINLTVNARDAIDVRGTIVVSLGYKKDMNAECTVTQKKIHGNWVVLSVSDEGCGIPKKIINNIFDPFFTTKEVGKGTGMGLATIYGILLNHRGHIIVDSEVNKGSTFQLLFPPLDEDEK